MSNWAQLAEGASNLLVSFIQQNISGALDVVGANVGIPQVMLDNPKSYFIYEQPQAYECPAVFVVIDEQDFKVQERKPNSINAEDVFNISVVVEDQDADLLTYKAWRYQSALFNILNLATITASDSSLVLKCVVYRAKFSQVYSQKQEGGKFRKEIMLECRIAHFEKF